MNRDDSNILYVTRLSFGDLRVGRSKESIIQLLTSAYPALTCDVLRVFLEVLTQFYNVLFKGLYLLAKIACSPFLGLHIYYVLYNTV